MSAGNEDATGVVWSLPRLFRSDRQAEFALLILNQPLERLHLLRVLWDNALIRVAADGGANYLCKPAAAQGQGSYDNLDVIIGDLDSLSGDARSYFQSQPHPPQIICETEQMSTDFAKAVRYLRRSHPGPMDIIVIGGLGGRVDQALSQLHHLYLFQQDSHYSEGRVYLVSADSLTFVLTAGKHQIRVRDGDQEDVFGKHVGIVPIKEPARITTKGLEWDVEDWHTQFGGQMSTSNHLLPGTEVVQVSTTKDVIFTIAWERPAQNVDGV